MYVPTRIHKYTCSAQRSQKRASGILTLEKQAVKPPDVGTLEGTCSLQEQWVFLTTEPTLKSLEDLKSK